MNEAEEKFRKYNLKQRDHLENIDVNINTEIEEVI
jgi:hypothetical protein